MAGDSLTHRSLPIIVVFSSAHLSLSLVEHPDEISLSLPHFTNWTDPFSHFLLPLSVSDEISPSLPLFTNYTDPFSPLRLFQHSISTLLCHDKPSLILGRWSISP